MNRVRRCGLLLGAVSLGLVWAALASAQHDGVAGAAPPPPPGPGVLTVRIVNPAANTDGASTASVGGLPLALYALSPDGTPGYAGGETNTEGIFSFTGISVDPGIVYLIGVHYLDIPFGKRVTFEAGLSEAVAEIEVTEPTRQTGDVALEEVRLRIDWMGDHLVLREIVELSNAGEQVIQIPADDPDRAIASRPLAPGASDFSPGPGSIGDAVALEDGRVRIRGPLYPGDQQIEYRYGLPIAADARSIVVPVEVDRAAGRVVVVAGTSGIEVAGTRLIPSIDVQSDAGTPLRSWARAGLDAGEVLEVRVTLPESRLDVSLLSIPRSDVWVELDDTRMSATVDIQIELPPGAPVAGTPESPLLRVEIPSGATLQGVAPEAESLGLIPRDDGGFDVIGPIGAGTTSLGFSYHLPTGPDGVDLGMRFPREVETLNVLIADTGLALDSLRLHRRRPFRSGTRNYLHREAFNVSPDETVDLRVDPLRATGLSQNASLAMTIVAAAAGVFFLVAPLRSVARREAEDHSPEARLRAEREAIYTAISDLDHDFETAKLEESDYNEMREGLRADAIELMRRERGANQGDAGGSEAAGTPLSVAPTSEGDAASATGGYCPHCGGAVTPSWRFCSHCGGNLNPSAEASG